MLRILTGDEAGLNFEYVTERVETVYVVSYRFFFFVKL